MVCIVHKGRLKRTLDERKSCFFMKWEPVIGVYTCKQRTFGICARDSLSYAFGLLLLLHNSSFFSLLCSFLLLDCFCLLLSFIHSGFSLCAIEMSSYSSYRREIDVPIWVVSILNQPSCSSHQKLHTSFWFECDDTKSWKERDAYTHRERKESA